MEASFSPFQAPEPHEGPGQGLRAEPSEGLRPEQTPRPGCSLSLQRMRQAEDLIEVAELYLSAFPAQERRPLPAMLRAMRRPEAEFWRLDSTGRTVGLLTTWHLASLTFGEHFAILPALRGQGLGSEAIRQLRARSGHLLIEVEPPTDETSRRRIALYERLGFHLLTREYYQPAYEANHPPVPLLLMTTDPSLEGDRLETALHELRNTVYIKHD